MCGVAIKSELSSGSYSALKRFKEEKSDVDYRHTRESLGQNKNETEQPFREAFVDRWRTRSSATCEQMETFTKLKIRQFQSVGAAFQWSTDRRILLRPNPAKPVPCRLVFAHDEFPLAFPSAVRGQAWPMVRQTNAGGARYQPTPHVQ
jgi:hypothetical protein